MATYYIDPISGNNANTGLSFGQRWQNLVGKTLAAGDAVRCIASEAAVDTGINATFTDLSSTLTLASALTATISNCDSAWTASANVTATVNSTAGLYFEGTGAAQFVIAAGFTTGKVAYFDLGASTDFSAYQQVSFFMIGATTSFASNNWQIKLCSDTAGNTPVNTLTLPLGIQQSSYHAVTIDNGSALGNNIRSVALYVLSDPGATTVRLDNIIACLAPATAGALSLTSLVGKSTAGGGSEDWYPIESINGTAVVLGASLSTAAGSPGLRGYVGTTSTEALYRREPMILPTNGSNTVSTFGQLTNSGTEASPIVFSGGWNRTDMSTQTDVSWISMNSVNNIGFRGTSLGWLTFDKFCFSRGIAGYYFSSCNNITIDGYESVGNFGYGIFLDGTGGNITINSPRCNLGANYGIIPSSNCTINSASMNGNRVAAIAFQTGTGNIVNGITAVNNEAVVIEYGKQSNNFVYNLNSRATGTSVVSNDSGQGYLINPTYTEATVCTYPTTYGGGVVYSVNQNGVATSNALYFEGATFTQGPAAETGDTNGVTWQMAITSAIVATDGVSQLVLTDHVGSGRAPPTGDLRRGPFE
jgi:hypothetical protein